MNTGIGQREHLDPRCLVESIRRGRGLAFDKTETLASGHPMFVMREIIRAGGGVGPLPTFLAEEAVQSGAIVEVLPKIVLGTAAVYLVMPTKKHLPSRISAFKELVLDMLRRRPLTSPA